MRNWIAGGIVLVVLVASDIMLHDGKALIALQHSIQQSLTSVVD